jgi:hypothetical protein
MPGGLLQLVGVGAQNQFVNGNPSMTYFNAMYKRFSNFAMEHFRLDFRGTDMTLPPAGNRTFRCKIPRYADMLHDTYLCVNLPEIYSPCVQSQTIGSPAAYAYQFQWIPNIGYNMIEEVSVLINGTAIVTLTGEWMKLMTYMKYTNTKRAMIDQMVGNIPELYDPANANGRFNQYPNAIQPSANPTSPPCVPSITGRQLTIPLPFWFCEEIGQSLPLVALTEAEVEIVVTFSNIYDLFTIVDPRDDSPTFGQRIPGLAGDSVLGIQNFLSTPDFYGLPTNLSLQSWNLNPYIEANYIFLTETERAHVAGFERTYLIIQPRWQNITNEYGYNNLLIPMFNLCTRVVAVFQRSDLALLNQPDNYTNWEGPNTPPAPFGAGVGPLAFYSTGVVNPDVVYPQDILQEANLVFDGKDRFNIKNANFFRLIQNYKYTRGDTTRIPGIYEYSFGLDPSNPTQPSGAANGSMFNKTFLQHTLQVPPVGAISTLIPPVCVVKSTVFNPVPTVVAPGSTQVVAGDKNTPLFQPGQTITLYPNQPTNGMPFQYNGMVYIDSYNFLKVTSGTANVIFST